MMIGLFRRISHRTHHQNHGHVENDESWHPVGLFSSFFSLPNLEASWVCLYLKMINIVAVVRENLQNFG